MPLTHHRFDRTNSDPPKVLLRAGCLPYLLSTDAAPSETSGLKNTADANVGTPSLNFIAEPTAEPVAESITESGAAGVPSLPRRCAQCRKTTGLRRAETHCPRCRLGTRLAALLPDQLSPAVWERMRRVLCLPNKPKQFLPDQARAVCRMLDAFAGQMPVAEQTALTETELLARLLELPNLPASFAQIGGARNDAQTVPDGDRRSDNGGVNDAGNDPERGGAAVVAMTGDRTKTAVATVTTAAAAARRRPICAALFRQVAARQGLHCWWCGIPVVRESQIPLSERMLKQQETLRYRARGELREAAVATVDHLVRVADGGDNRPENLVVSCQPCNGKRERITVATRRSFAQNRTRCRICGGSFFHPDWGCCSICGAVPERIGGITDWLGRLARAVRRLAASLTAR